VFKNELSHVTDEINVAYVGFTRAKQHLHLPFEFQSVLTPKWSRLLERYQTPKKTYQPGDRVITKLGPGTIVEISGKYCLVNIATRETKLREHLSNVR